MLWLTSVINAAFSQRKQTNVIFTDFSIAFHKMNHKLLLTKLDLMVVNQTVRVNNSLSKYIYVLSGAPQGSHLGPFLFPLFMNNLSNMINFANILMFSDDVKVFLSFNNFIEHVYLISIISFWISFLLCGASTKWWIWIKCKMRSSRNNSIVVYYLLEDYQVEFGVLIQRQCVEWTYWISAEKMFTIQFAWPWMELFGFVFIYQQTGINKTAYP